MKETTSKFMFVEGGNLLHIYVHHSLYGDFICGIYMPSLYVDKSYKRVDPGEK